MPEPWERQVGERQGAFQAFIAYRDLPGKRSATRAAEKLNKGVHQLEVWCTKWHWLQRVEAWDDHLDEERRRTSEEAVREMGERHVRLAQNLQSKAVASLIAMGDVGPEEKEIPKWIDTGVKLERLATGQSTETIRQGQIDDATDQELRRRILSDPRARRLALELAEALDPGDSDAGGPGENSEP